jgi:hypothetical protein
MVSKAYEIMLTILLAGTWFIFLYVFIGDHQSASASHTPIKPPYPQTSSFTKSQLDVTQSTELVRSANQPSSISSSTLRTHSAILSNETTTTSSPTTTSFIQIEPTTNTIPTIDQVENDSIPYTSTIVDSESIPIQLTTATSNSMHSKMIPTMTEPENQTITDAVSDVTPSTTEDVKHSPTMDTTYPTLLDHSDSSNTRATSTHRHLPPRTAPSEPAESDLPIRNRGDESFPLSREIPFYYSFYQRFNYLIRKRFSEE